MKKFMARNILNSYQYDLKSNSKMQIQINNLTNLGFLSNQEVNKEKQNELLSQLKNNPSMKIEWNEYND